MYIIETKLYIEGSCTKKVGYIWESCTQKYILVIDHTMEAGLNENPYIREC